MRSWNYRVPITVACRRLQEYGDRAMESLTKAIVEGFNDAAHMVKDPDLDPLRERADFTNLLGRVRATEPKEPETKP